jgi:hypothetical protein
MGPQAWDTACPTGSGLRGWVLRLPLKPPRRAVPRGRPTCGVATYPRAAWWTPWRLRWMPSREAWQPSSTSTSTHAHPAAAAPVAVPPRNRRPSEIDGHLPYLISSMLPNGWAGELCDPGAACRDQSADGLTSCSSSLPILSPSAYGHYKLREWRAVPGGKGGSQAMHTCMRACMHALRC